MGNFSLKKTNPNMQNQYTGKVKFFNPTKGFGFIQGSDGNDYFAHWSQIQMEGHKSLALDQDVEFSIEPNPQSGKMMAVNITGPGGAPPIGQQQQFQGGYNARGGFNRGGRGGYNQRGRGGYNQGGRGGYNQGSFGGYNQGMGTGGYSNAGMGRGGYNMNFSGEYDNSR